jgi:hypothetical protein
MDLSRAKGSRFHIVPKIGGRLEKARSLAAPDAGWRHEPAKTGAEDVLSGDIEEAGRP